MGTINEGIKRGNKRNLREGAALRKNIRDCLFRASVYRSKWPG